MVLAAEIIIHAVMTEGLYGTSIPFFGIERRGSPVACFVRIDDRPIREKDQIYKPDCIMVGDQSLFSSVDIFAGVKEGAILVLNSTKDPKIDALPPQIARLGVVDATKIALEVLGIPVVNTAMVGAFAMTTHWIQVQSILEGIRQVMPQKLAERNAEAARRAAQEIRIVDIQRMPK